MQKMTPEMDSLVKRKSVAVLSREPAVLAAFDVDFEREPAVLAAFDVDFERKFDAFAAFARANPKTTVLLQLGYEHETPELAAKLGEVVSRFRSEVPDSRVIAMGNYPKARVTMIS